MLRSLKTLSAVIVCLLVVLIAPNVYSQTVTKSVTPATAKPADTVTYTITYNADFRPPPPNVITITSSAACPASDPNAAVTISGSSTVVVCDGGRTWRSLTVTNGATLTQSPISQGGANNPLVVTIRDTLTISNQGTIDVSGKGYAGSTNPHSYIGPCSPTSCNSPGNGQGPGGGLAVGDSPGCEERVGTGGGGSHGGTGAAAWQSPGGSYVLPQQFGNSGIAPTYDDPNFPQIAGSAGGNWISHTHHLSGCSNNGNGGSAGGGALRIRAAKLVSDATAAIIASGANADASGAGAGGGVVIEVENPIIVRPKCLNSSCTAYQADFMLEAKGGNGYLNLPQYGGQNGTTRYDSNAINPNLGSNGFLTVRTNGGSGGGKGGSGGGGGIIAIKKVAAGTISGGGPGATIPTYVLRDELPTGVTYVSASPAPSLCGQLNPAVFQCWNNTVLDPDGDGKISGSITLTAKLSQTIGCGQSTNYATLLVTQGGITTPLPAGSAMVTVLCTPVIQSFTGSPTTITATSPVLSLAYTIANLQNGDSGRIQETCTGFSRTNTYNNLALVVPNTNATYAVTFPTNVVLNGNCGYTLEVLRGGSVVASKSVSIAVNIVPAPTITASVVPTVVAPGGSFTLNWTYSNANTVTTDVVGAGCQNPGTLSPPPPLSAGILTNGSKQLVAPNAAPTTCSYRLTAAGPSGSVTSAPVVLTVNTSGGGGGIGTSCGLLVCFSYDPKVIILPPPGFTQIIKPKLEEIAP
ncbi:hypothetical protein HYZ64_01335 [Candidatus Berkelbacteria bacterium]|nr:hypothetical protein [Candidatus Berkelbacteria bacterium]